MAAAIERWSSLHRRRQPTRPWSKPGEIGHKTTKGLRKGLFTNIRIDLDTPVGQKELQTISVFGEVGQSFAEWGLPGDTGTVMDKPSLHLGDQWR
ncbi:hypothetical protein EDE05_102286 [Neorhizobium sp. R1-B]|jgi:hypothetical protein|nr:hypothetical protein EDE05_102286 [Neorhizobium sp. R1-B]